VPRRRRGSRGRNPLGGFRPCGQTSSADSRLADNLRRGVKIVVVGAGQVGSTVVEALHGEHDLTVVDTVMERLEGLAYRFDVRTIEGNGASRKTIQEAGAADADLFIACTSRDEVNLVACSFARVEAPRATTVIRASNVEYIDLWREGRLDVDFAVSSEIETAHAVSRSIGLPAARQTDVFAEGQVQIVEFEVPAGADPDVVQRPLRDARIPADSRVLAIIRQDSMTLPRGDDVIREDDRIVVIGSPQGAREWGGLLAPGERTVEDVVVFGGGHVGAAIAQMLATQGIGVRVIEPQRERAREVAEELPNCRVYNATGMDPDFLERERIGQAQAAVFAMKEDEKNHYAAVLARVYGVRFTIAVVHDPISTQVYERSGIDVTINPRGVTAEEIVRFAHDPRTQQVSMLEGDRYEVLDITTQPTSEYVGLRFRDMPIRGALIGAIVRDGRAVFPRSDDVLQAGDRVIVFTETSRAADVEKVL
jgi:trk system potassium uptake protein TrkA